MKTKLQRYGFYLKQCYSKGIKSIHIKEDMIVINLDADVLKSYLKFLKANNFLTLLDIWGSDFPEREKRFEVNYLLLNIKYNIRVILRVNASAEDYIESSSNLYNSAEWLEREVWDMYGVYFWGNKDLRRILTDYGFEGHPLRKDFPLTGFVEVRYDENEKRVVTETLELAQGFRLFKFLSPWGDKQTQQ